MPKTYTVTFTDDEAAAIERYAESMVALGWPECTPEQWIRDLVADHLKMRRFVAVPSSPPGVHPSRHILGNGDWF